MVWRGLRLAVRGIVVVEDQLLLVNAFRPGAGPELWCAPGGGVEAHKSLPDNLSREIYEETGLGTRVGELALVNEFHDPEAGFHQVELYFRCSVTEGALDPAWEDPEGVVRERRFFARDVLAGLPMKPARLAEVAFQPGVPAVYDPFERMLR